MHVQFEFTQDDLIDASKRCTARLKSVRSFHLKNLIATSLLTWLFIFLLFYRAPVKGAIFGFVGAVISALLFPGLNRRGLEKRMRKIAKEVFGDAKSFLCEVELRSDGVWLRQMGRQMLYEWPSVEEIQDTSDSVDIFTRDGSGIVVRNRAFSTAEERSKFLELARASLGSTSGPTSDKRLS